MIQSILRNIPTPCPWRDTVYWYDTLESTNTKAKELAKAGALHGTVVIAGNQTAGRGRMGRSFSSPDGMGVYLSVILRFGCTADKLMHLTCAAGVAAMQAVEAVCGICPDIKCYAVLMALYHREVWLDELDRIFFRSILCCRDNDLAILDLC